MMACILGGSLSSRSQGSPGALMSSTSHKPFQATLRKADTALNLESLLKDAGQGMA